MLRTIRHYLKTFAFFAKLSIQQQLEYPAFLITWIIGVPLQWFAGIWMMQIMLERFQSLNGWGFNEIAFLYGISLLSHGVMVIFFIPTWHLDHHIIKGELDRMLVRPMSVYFQFIFQFINFIGFLDLIPGLVIFIYACGKVNFDPSFINVIKVLLVVFGGTLIRAGFYTMTGTFAFWTKRSGEIIGLSIQLLEKSTQYPLSIYPRLLQVILTFILPFAFISFYPASSFLNKSAAINLPLAPVIWTPVIGLVYFFLARSLFKFGLKKYESAGS